MDVLILGLDIHGKECADIISRVGWNLLGFISQTPEHPEAFGGFPVLGGEEAVGRYPSAGLIPLHVWKSQKDMDRWVPLIDPSAFIASTAQIGRGCVIYPQCFVGANARLEEGILMLTGCVVNHDCVIGSRTTLTSRVTLAGGVTVGAASYLGQSCTVRQQLTIGHNALVGMGAVVIRNVADKTTVIGNPARPLVK